MASVRQLVSVTSGVLGAILVTTSAPAAPVANEPTLMETRVLAALNDARLNPQAYIADLAAYRKRFKNKLVTMPGSRVKYLTREGTVPIDEAVEFLNSEESRSQLRAGSILAAAAADHVAEQGRSGHTGHIGSNGSGPADRTSRRGGGRLVAEVITYGAFDAADVVRQLIVDDGVPDRGHRSAIFADRLRYAGVACGYHPKFRTMCVIDMAETPDGTSRSLRPSRLASIAG
ncbi:CAP domain-containing protein [Sphingomonas sp. AP4-R1]|jgi:uncharacterized protein YkwD|uniref:CAP domain-containing protein n=1 Tax=Sphingomonas sp. AP4-R1 TaxID=2735134 RepID=UPI0014935120|nr:CAP domain-containing protein [Sphingomonas sp. AP4-R1]QJU59205.1 CAP domain-containing protein [Sphingomonas sp. AP4-R1]